MFFVKERIERALKDLRKLVHRGQCNVDGFLMKEGDYSSFKEADDSKEPWGTLEFDQLWGGKDQRYWFRSIYKIPEVYEGETVVFTITTGKEGQWDAINPQFLMYLDGEVVQGLDVNHREVVVKRNAVAGESVTIDLHGYAGMQEDRVKLQGQFAVLEEPIEKLFYDIKVPFDVAMLLDKEDLKRINILNYLNEALNRMDLRTPYSKAFYDGVNDAEQYLAEDFYEGFCGGEGPVVTCVGHTHIDVAWLWTLRQTREKVARSYSTVLNLMAAYPEYIFMASQPQLFEYLKEEHPDIYEKVKEKVKAGVWEAEGAMWLEADCNLSSGESLIRQILYGLRFFKEEFNLENKVLWLPDVFGYSSALPQILKRFGIEYFVTTKISWNEYNKMPYDTFVWEGMDGSEVLAHFITTADYQKGASESFKTIYEGSINPSQVKGAWQRYQQKDINENVLMSYGYGDGGGGPTKEMLENGRRLSKGIPGSPTVKYGNVRSYLEGLEKRLEGRKKVPRWVGELYLEYHRGTYTTMAKNKLFNRKSEILYQDVEFLATANSLVDPNARYPQKQLNQGWKTILLNQFHDIIPGTSIKEVYDESHEQYQEILAKGKALADEAVEKIAGQIGLEGSSVVVFNSLSFCRSAMVEFELPEGNLIQGLRDEAGNVYGVQHSGDKGAFFGKDVPSKGYKAFEVIWAEDGEVVDSMGMEAGEEARTDAEKLLVSTDILSNRYFDITLDDHGDITSIFDKKACREIIKKPMKGNQFQAFDDRPHNWEAWDVNIHYQEKMWDVTEVESIKVLEEGPVRGTLEITKRFMNSKIKQKIHIYEDINRIDFETEVDWQERNIFLKVAFPVDVHSQKATYEIQYGNVERPTHWNTSWDLAKFEVCAHKWADLSEDDYGVSLINDCKYGYDIKDGVMRLSLIKSPTWPYPEADLGHHEFKYALYPHQGNWKDGKTVQQAYSFNAPMYSTLREPRGGLLPRELSFIKVDQENVIMEVVKRAEAGSETIVRIYEAYNRRSTVNVQCVKRLVSAFETDLNEENIEEIQCIGRGFSFEIKPYEIRTVKLKFY